MAGLGVVGVLAIAIAVLLVSPSIVFLAVALAQEMSPGEALAALKAQYAAERVNLLVISVLGLLPMLLPLALLGYRRLRRLPMLTAAPYVVGAAAATLLVLLVMHMQYWPSFLPERAPLGFPHGLEFVVGPFVYAPLAVLLVWAVQWLLERRS